MKIFYIIFLSIFSIYICCTFTSYFMGHHSFTPSKAHLEQHDILKCTLNKDDFPETDQKILKERDVFLQELEENACFKIENMTSPYRVRFGLHGSKLAISAFDAGAREKTHIFSLMPYRSMLAEYRDIKVTYQDIVSGLSSMHLETIDMARRGLHNEASEVIKERFAKKITIDFETGRKIFALLSVLIRV